MNQRNALKIFNEKNKNITILQQIVRNFMVAGSSMFRILENKKELQTAVKANLLKRYF